MSNNKSKEVTAVNWQRNKKHKEKLIVSLSYAVTNLEKKNIHKEDYTEEFNITEKYLISFKSKNSPKGNDGQTVLKRNDKLVWNKLAVLRML